MCTAHDVPQHFLYPQLLGIRDCSFKQQQLKAVEGGRSEVKYRQMLPFAALSCSESPLPTSSLSGPPDMMQEVGDGWRPPHPHQWVWGLYLTGKQTEALRFIPCPRCLSQGNSRPGLPSAFLVPSLSARLDHRPPHHSPLFPKHLSPQPCQAPRSLQPTRWAHLGRSGRWKSRSSPCFTGWGADSRSPARAMKCREWAAGLKS